ncbi:MAG: hypothetical protein HY939_07605 [Gammaproteobacteria bacterium]|nr:hypothetical protein [Gammaproteobacteria bacterium]
MQALKQSPSGFSLLETLLWSALAAVLMAVSLPSVMMMLDRVRLETAVSTWVEYLQEGRMLAIERHEKIYILPTHAPNWTEGLSLRNDHQLLKQSSALEKSFSVTWRSFPAQYSYLIFQGNGLLENENGHFVFCYKQLCKTIIVPKGGQAEVMALPPPR